MEHPQIRNKLCSGASASIDTVTAATPAFTHLAYSSQKRGQSANTSLPTLHCFVSPISYLYPSLQHRRQHDLLTPHSRFHHKAFAGVSR